jgi:hypothetical protein
MISSRDFVLYVLVIMCLVGGMLFTLAREGVRDPVAFSEEVTEYGVVPTDPKYDTNQRLLTLQQKITSGDGLLESAPPVFKSLDQLRAESAAEEAAAEEAASSTALTVQNCGFVANGPLWSGIEEVEVQPDEIEFISYQTVGTTTEAVVTLTLPRRTIRSSFESCIDNRVIGATTNGDPLFKTEVSRYRAVSSATRIGYLRDGFALYGPIADPTTLDRCGGRYVGGVYQYHVRRDNPTLISCFAGIPAAVSINQ